MPAMEQHSQLKSFLDLETRLRTGVGIDPQQKESLNPYWRDLLDVLEWFRKAKEAGGYERAADAIPPHSPYRVFLSNLAAAQAATLRGHAKHATA
jgi:hypothetical protein